jgi:hypothetical protein
MLNVYINTVIIVSEVLELCIHVLGNSSMLNARILVNVSGSGVQSTQLARRENCWIGHSLPYTPVKNWSRLLA